MKLIKLTDDHYVVVDDTEIKESDYYLFTWGGEQEIQRFSKEQYADRENHKHLYANACKKITHSTQPMPHGAVREGQITGVTAISLQEVKELIGEVDVEKKAREEILYNDSKREWWKQGYNQAFEDNKEKKYTEDDLLSAFNAGIDCEFGGAPSFDIWVKSIQPKTEWEVEWETIDNRQPCDCSCHKNPNMVHFVACCNDGWIGKVTQKLKLK